MFKKNYLPHMYAKAALVHLGVIFASLMLVPMTPILASPIVLYGLIGYYSYMWSAAKMPYPLDRPLILKFWDWAGQKWRSATMPCQIEMIDGSEKLTRWPFGFGYKEVYTASGKRLGHYQYIWDEDKDMTFVKHDFGGVLPLLARLRSPRIKANI